ncbi:MAG TPA: glycosyltransferase family 4 protein, partial [candidate division Zixibacteria bacterium]|nr:glycosyltransferase family 4 protein [candidate division Zixibacteria bacterium]
AGKPPQGSEHQPALTIIPGAPDPFLEPVDDSEGEVTLKAEARQFAANGTVTELIRSLHAADPIDLICERCSLFSVGGIAAARELGLPHILELNAPLVKETRMHRRLMLDPLAEAIEKYLYTQTDCVIPVSAQLGAHVRKVAPNARVEVIPNGVDVERFASGGGRSPQRAGVDIGFVGSLKPWHGVELLVEAFAQIAGELTDSRLVIIGDGPIRTSLEADIAARGLGDRVVFLGARTHDDIPATMGKTDILVAPYPKLDDFYFSPLKIYEYMAAGKAIVSSRIGQIAEILEHDQTAYLVSPGDVGELARALRTLGADATRRARLGRAARAAALAHHSWERRLKSWEKVFQTAAVPERKGVAL